VARVLPDIDLMLVTLLRDGLGTGVEVQNLRPADFLDRLPMVTARRIPGGGPPANWRFRDTAPVDVQTWAATRAQASDLAQECLVVLCSAADRQAVLPGLGSIKTVVVTAGPGELREADQPGRLSRFQAGYRVTVRPLRG
jgi:hypothetical protein